MLPHQSISSSSFATPPPKSPKFFANPTDFDNGHFMVSEPPFISQIFSLSGGVEAPRWRYLVSDVWKSAVERFEL